jgi:hypothetical protein
MAIDRTGISSLEVGAPDIKYTGDQGPKSPDQQLMASADPMLVEEYNKYVFEMEEQGLQPISFKEFVQQIMSGMAQGGIARLGLFRGALADTRRGVAMSPGTSADYSPGQGHRETRESRGGPPGITTAPTHIPTVAPDIPSRKDVWNVGTPSTPYNPGVSAQRNRVYNIRQRQLKNFLEGDEDRKKKELVDEWFETPSQWQATGSDDFSNIEGQQAKLKDLALGQYRVLQKKKGMSELGGPEFTPTDQKFLDKLEKMMKEDKM